MERIKQNDNEIVDWMFFMKKRVNVGGVKSSLERTFVFGAREPLAPAARRLCESHALQSCN